MTLIHDPALFKLGKRPPKNDPRNLKLDRYLTVDLPPAPASADWGDKVSAWGVMKNDQFGDCTCAAVGHAVMAFTADTGAEFTPTDDEVIELYTTVTGQEGAAFDPATGANDNGCMINDVLNEWRKNGFAGHQLGAYASVKPAHFDHVKAAIAYFGVLDIGVQLPITAQTQDVWDIMTGPLTPDAVPGSWGGHSVLLVSYTPDGLDCITWGQRKRLTWAWLQLYCDEAFALLSQDWVSGTKSAPSGFDLTQLQADLAAVTA